MLWYYRKAETEVLFDKSLSCSEGENLYSKSAAEAQVLVRTEYIGHGYWINYTS